MDCYLLIIVTYRDIAIFPLSPTPEHLNCLSQGDPTMKHILKLMQGHATHTRHVRQSRNYIWNELARIVEERAFL